MFCQNCGNKLEENAVICTNCGTSVVDESKDPMDETPNRRFTENPEQQAQPESPPQTFAKAENQQVHHQNVVKEDKPNIAVNILSLCCIPILGIVMFFVWKDSQPRAAKSALIFSLINIGLAVIIYIILAVFGVFVNILNPTTYE